MQPPKQRLIAAPRDGLAQLAKFAVEAMQPDPNGATPARDIRAAYLRWCRERDKDALPAPEMADYQAEFCDKAGLQISADDDQPAIRGVRLVA